MDYIKVIRRMIDMSDVQFEIETPAGTVVVKGNDLGLESNRSDRCYRLVLRRHEENG
jgi:hypothetical protein